jgi:DNA-binding NtrC family response regulator
MTVYSIFVIDDEAVAREGLSLALKKKNYRVRAFDSAAPAIRAIEQNPPDLILLDIGLPGMSGVAALEKIKVRHPAIIVIMITAYEDVKTVVSAMKLGAYDYVVKPLQVDSLLVVIRNALQTIAMRKEIQDLHQKYVEENLPCFIGNSNVIQDMMAVVKKVARSPDTAILIQGESGTGKELIARAIHYRSPNRGGNLVEVNCAAIPGELIESELFGYEKGAFSGAKTAGKAGLVEKAANGTLFLDEIGDLSVEAQAKLLRFIEEGEYYRVGATKKRSVQTRIVSATNKDLAAMIADGDFRQDLYFRLAVVRIEIPALNQRRDDILPLARHFLDQLGNKFGKSFSGISSEAEKVLKAYNWTGNVRELKNVVEKGILLSDGPELKLDFLGLKSDGSGVAAGARKNSHSLPPIVPAGVDFQALITAIEKRYLQEALEMSGGNESKAARLLHLSRDTFRYRRQKLSI